MNIPYRTRRALRKLGIAALALVLIFVVVYLVWLLWLERYVVYSRDGAKLDFSLSAGDLSGQAAVPPEPRETVNIIYNNGDNAVDTSTDLTRLSGYYITAQDMAENMAGIRQAVESLPSNIAIMLDVKNTFGYMSYSSSVAKATETVNVTDVDELIAYLRSKHVYLIARMPAFRDYDFGLHNVPCGLPVEEGYLWADEDNCYWLNPDSAGTINHLIQIVAELKTLGFNEVVFTDFCFPNTDEIVYENDKTEALNKAAKNLVSSCANSTFAVSFETVAVAIQLPEGRCRQYLQNISAVNIQATVEQAALSEPDIQLVFITEANDTRFDEYGVLRPISLVQIDEPQTQPEDSS